MHDWSYVFLWQRQKKRLGSTYFVLEGALRPSVSQFTCIQRVTKSHIKENKINKVLYHNKNTEVNWKRRVYIWTSIHLNKIPYLQECQTWRRQFFIQETGYIKKYWLIIIFNKLTKLIMQKECPLSFGFSRTKSSFKGRIKEHITD